MNRLSEQVFQVFSEKLIASDFQGVCKAAVEDVKLAELVEK